MSVTGEPVVRACEVDTTGHGGGDEKKWREASTDAKEPLKGVLRAVAGARAVRG
jgi:hypothetical protein